jgi:hypothetical protein
MPDSRFALIGAVVLAFGLAAVAVGVARSVIHRMLDALEIVSAENREAVQARARQLVNALTLLAYGVAAVASVTFALERFGLGEARWNARAAGRWRSSTCNTSSASATATATSNGGGEPPRSAAS